MKIPAQQGIFPNKAKFALGCPNIIAIINRAHLLAIGDSGNFTYFSYSTIDDAHLKIVAF